MDTADFDFLNQPEEAPEPLIPEVVFHGPNTKDLKRITRKHLVQDMLDAYVALGGLDYLIGQAKADPKNYFEILKKLIPTNLQFDAEEIAVTLIDQYGRQMKLEKNNGDTKIASTSRDLASPRSKEELLPEEAAAPQIIVKEEF